MDTEGQTAHHEPWNKGKIVGQKAPFKVKDIWALRVRLQMEGRVRELALFNLGIDSKLRGCDLVALKVRDVTHGDQVATRAIVMQHKTKRPVQFEITGVTREALQAWIKEAELKSDDFLFPSRLHESPHLGTRQYARILGHWVDELGLDRSEYGTHSMRSKRQLSTLLTRSLWDSQTSRMCRSKPKPTRHCVPSPGSMVAVRLLMRTMVPTTVCRYLSSKATFSPQRKSLRVGRGAAGGSGATA